MTGQVPFMLGVVACAAVLAAGETSLAEEANAEDCDSGICNVAAGERDR